MASLIRDDGPSFIRAIEDASRIGRTVEGVALTWDRQYRVSDDDGRSFYLEGFKRGVFAKGITARRNVFELRLDHVDERVGTVKFAESARGLDFAATVDDDDFGNAVLEHVDRGDISRVSLRYSSRHQDRVRGVVWRRDVVPRELSIVIGAKAQYDDARIEAIRAMHPADPAELALAAKRAARSAKLLARADEMVTKGAGLLL